MPNNHKLCPKCNGIMHRQSKQCRKCYIEEKLKPENYHDFTLPVGGKGYAVMFG
jgi:ribosomal protein L40E